MKFPALLLAFFLVCSLGIAGYIHSRRKPELQISKQASFQDIKFRVTRDVLEEYKDQLIQGNILLNKTKTEVDTLTKDVSVDKTFAEKKKGDVDTCKGDKKRLTDEIAAAESEKKHIESEFVKEKSHWATEVDSLQNQLVQLSTLCKYIDKTSEEGRKLCNITQEPQQPEAKPKESQAEKPKAEEPNAEQPKPEEPKAEQPKANVQ
ncbi:uncharacterized protein LOC132103579 [Carassius carassius]|uniref:uncharacterized protein LOC132103579 n=1 Tax=Carassius carassius TaxID=217509 RepID=UPI0028689E56|nr:uncharacterized protein LOC132103579 [Carassius carassius]